MTETFSGNYSQHVMDLCIRMTGGDSGKRCDKRYMTFREQEKSMFEVEDVFLEEKICDAPIFRGINGGLLACGKCAIRHDDIVLSLKIEKNKANERENMGLPSGSDNPIKRLFNRAKMLGVEPDKAMMDCIEQMRRESEWLRKKNETSSKTNKKEI